MFEQIVARRGLRRSSTLSTRGFAIPHPHLLVAVLTVFVLAGVDASLASAGSRAGCDFRIHVVVGPATGPAHLRTIRPTRTGRAQCTGTLATRLVDGAGWFDAVGSFRPRAHPILAGALGTLGGCGLGDGSVSFLAAVPVFLADRSVLHVSGSLRTAWTAAALILSGSGRVGPISPISPGSHRITYTGIGDLRPDRGQTCSTASRTSWTLSLRVVVTGPH